jgi:hypothetical protein
MGKLHPAFADAAEDAFIPHGSGVGNIVVVVAGANNAGVSTVCPSITISREIGNNATQLIRSRHPG